MPKNTKTKSKKGKKKPSAGGTARKAPRQPATRHPAMKAAVTSRIAHKVCAITDPFCPAARGSKWPDDTSKLTLGLPFRARIPFVTDNAGYATVMFLPGFKYQYSIGDVTGAGLVATFVNLTTLGVPTLTPAQYRIVSWGVRLRHMSVPTEASGMVRIRSFPACTASAISVVDPATFNCDFNRDIPLQDCNEVVIIGKRSDTHETYNFVNPVDTNPGTTVASYVSNGWQALCITVVGGPISKPVLDIEFVYNFEVTFPDSDAMAQLGTKVVKSDPQAITLHSRLVEKAGSVFIDTAQKGADLLLGHATQIAAATTAAAFPELAVPLMLALEMDQ